MGAAFAAGKTRRAGGTPPAGGRHAAGGAGEPPRVPVLLAAGGEEGHLRPDPGPGPGETGGGTLCLLLAGEQPSGAGPGGPGLRLCEGDPDHAAP